jgi:hypothetical protein
VKNSYEVRGDITVIFVKKGKYGIYECLIDTEDLSKVDEGCDTNWHLSNNGKGKYYVVGSKRINGKPRTVKLHRVVTSAPKGKVVDHIKGNTLDNRKFMLRVVTQLENNQNSKMQYNNKSGVRGLYFHERDQVWIGQIWSNNKCHHIGSWKPDQFEVAKAEMEKARKKLHKYAQEVKDNVTTN